MPPGIYNLLFSPAIQIQHCPFVGLGMAQPTMLRSFVFFLNYVLLKNTFQSDTLLARILHL